MGFAAVARVVCRVVRRWVGPTGAVGACSGLPLGHIGSVMLPGLMGRV